MELEGWGFGADLYSVPLPKVLYLQHSNKNPGVQMDYGTGNNDDSGSLH